MSLNNKYIKINFFNFAGVFLFCTICSIFVNCDQNTQDLPDNSSDTVNSTTQSDLNNIQNTESETSDIDESCTNFTERSDAVKTIDNHFRIFAEVINTTTLTITWNRPSAVQNESICGYVLVWSSLEHKMNSENHISTRMEPHETVHTLTHLNNSQDYWLHVELYLQGGSKVVTSTDLHVTRGWGKNIVGNYLESDHAKRTTPGTISYFFKKEAMHPISSIVIVILTITTATLFGVVMVAVCKCISIRAGVPYIFNRPVLNTHESLGRARNKVKKMRNIFKDGSRGDTVNFSTLVDQSEFEC